MGEAAGVLPDDVIRDPRASSWLVFVDLAPGLGATGAKAWLQKATAAVEALTAARADGARVASVASAIGAGFATKAGAGADRLPLGLRSLPALVAGVTPTAHDLAFYVMASSDAAVAQFVRDLDATRPDLARIDVDRGFQRGDGRETFGLRDGLRNGTPGERARTAFVDADGQPGEPAWARGGSYLAYMKIRQNTAAWASLTPAQQAEVVGRRSDGSRLDQPEGADPKTGEPAFTDAANPAGKSHIRKAGPRGADQDPVAMFRRGTPYLTTTADGTLDQGLQFVSFQADLAVFTTILDRWMLNTAFPTPGTGVDALMDPAGGLVTVLLTGFYFVLPPDSRFLGAGLFDADTGVTSHVIIRKTVLDAQGNPDPTASLEGAAFLVTDTNGQPLGAPFRTDAAGRARSGPLPTGIALTLTEVTPPPGAQASGPRQITLDCHPTMLDWPNARVGAPGQYGA